MADFGRLPHMTEPLGRHWGHGRDLRERVRIYETHATIDASDWERLPRYDSSMPSGVYAGKAWRRGRHLCWYGKPRKIVERGREIEVCSNGCIRALVQGPGSNLTFREVHHG